MPAIPNFDMALADARSLAEEDRRDHDEQMALLSKALEAQQLEGKRLPEEVHALQEEAESFPFASHVALRGLKARPELNGKRGIVSEFDPATRRFKVTLEELNETEDASGPITQVGFTGESVKVKPANLVRSPRLPHFVGIAAKLPGAASTRVVLEWLDTCSGDLEARQPIHNDSLLTIAAVVGNEQLVKELLRRGANVVAKARSDTTALMYAAGSGHVSVAKLLMAASADPLQLDAHGNNAIEIALLRGHHEAAQALYAVALPAGSTAAADSVMLTPGGLGDAATRPVPPAGLAGEEAPKIKGFKSDFSIEEQLAATAGDVYSRLVVRSTEASARDPSKAIELLREAIALNPDKGAAYFNLGWQLMVRLDPGGALAAFQQAAERWAEDGPNPDVQCWARAISAGFCFRNSGCGEGQEPPSHGWDDQSLMKVSSRVVAAGSGEPEAWEMRATVLAGFLFDGRRPRSQQQYLEASKCFRRSAEINKHMGLKEGDHLQQAALCDKLAGARDAGEPQLAQVGSTAYPHAHPSS
jgi:tetratricopeptide (TPR) repeat protein